MIAVAVAGAHGRMGQEACQAVLAQADMRLVGALDPSGVGGDAGRGVSVTDHLEEALRDAQVMVDFTRGDVAPANVLGALSRKVACVVGTTGISSDDLRRIEAASAEHGRAVLVAPNFALGAVLMMRFAQEAAKYYEWAEIIELHHENKIDAPSGTALRTADMMAESRPSFKAVAGETEKLGGARGAQRGGVHLHSVRLPGLVAHQEVILGASGETLTIRHDSMHRASFMPGVMLAIRRILDRQGLIVGLEHLM
jgi:4-hydroxy-tetrahydrodipicolinate reductase